MIIPRSFPTSQRPPTSQQTAPRTAPSSTWSTGASQRDVYEIGILTSIMKLGYMGCLLELYANYVGTMWDFYGIFKVFSMGFIWDFYVVFISI